MPKPYGLGIGKQPTASAMSWSCNWTLGGYDAPFHGAKVAGLFEIESERAVLWLYIITFRVLTPKSKNSFSVKSRVAGIAYEKRSGAISVYVFGHECTNGCGYGFHWG